MHRRILLMGAISSVLASVINSQIDAAETQASGAPDRAIIYYSAAPWDGAAYAIEIPLERTDDASQPFIHINIWGNPEFAELKTLSFSGREDSGGGPGKGVGRASYQAILNKSWPENLAGSITFKTLLKDQPVLATYELATLDGKKKFKGSFQAAWGNKPPRVIR